MADRGRQEIFFVEVDGARVRVSRWGLGPRPLLLVMGLGGNIEMWGPFEDALAVRGVPTVAFDAPGMGESSRGPQALMRMGDLARHTIRLLDELGLGELDVLGVSFGGLLSQELARQAGRRVRRLVLAATACGLGGLPGNPRAMAILATPRRYHSAENFARVAPVLYGGRIRREPELLGQQALARLGKPPSTAGYLAQIYAVTGWTSVPWLHHLGQPTLVLAGDDDPIVPLVNGRFLAWRIPRAELHVVKGGGHLFLLEQADEMAELVAGFLRR
jgi:poly(3-hydroxyalkanoate) depolymerase